MQDTNQNPPAQDKKTKRPASKTALGIALRIILVLIIGIIVGSALYFSASGWIPYLDQRIFQPIQDNQAQIQGLRETQGALAGEFTTLSTSVQELQTSSEQELRATLSVLEGEISNLAQQAETLQNQVEQNTAYSATTVPGLLATAGAQRESLSRNLSALATAQRSDAINRDEIELLRIMELFSRTNQYLLHDNYGLAEDELATARDRLLSLEEGLAPAHAALVQDLLVLVNGAISDLPARPTQAELKLESAWLLTLNGFPNIGDVGTITPTPYPLQGTPTPTPN